MDLAAAGSGEARGSRGASRRQGNSSLAALRSDMNQQRVHNG